MVNKSYSILKHRNCHYSRTSVLTKLHLFNYYSVYNSDGFQIKAARQRFSYYRPTMKADALMMIETEPIPGDGSAPCKDCVYPCKFNPSLHTHCPVRELMVAYRLSSYLNK